MLVVLSRELRPGDSVEELRDLVAHGPKNYHSYT